MSSETVQTEFRSVAKQELSFPPRVAVGGGTEMFSVATGRPKGKDVF